MKNILVYTFAIVFILLLALTSVASFVPSVRQELIHQTPAGIASFFGLEHDHAEHADEAAQGDHADEDHDHADEDHDHAAEDHAGHNHAQEPDPDSLALTDQALKNIGITAETIGEATLGDYSRTIAFPAVIVERPGQTLTKIPAPAIGIVEKIYVESGQMIERGQPLFEVHLTHEDVISNQYELLTLLRKRDIIEKEEKRLAPLEYGIAPIEKRDIEYQRLENTTAIDAMKKTLAVHGLPPTEVESEIIGKRNMIDRIIVYAPTIDEDCLDPAMNGRETTDEKAQNMIKSEKTESETTAEHAACAHHHQIDDIFVKKGQMVDIGEPLCQISDMDVLFIEGRAYAYNEPILREAMAKRFQISATLQEAGERQEAITGLTIRNIDNRVDPRERTLNFYVELHNELDAHDESAEIKRGSVFLNWRYKPGQRGELAVEYDKVEQQIVLPVAAMVRELNDCYVFEWVGMDGKNRVFKRRPVHVIHQGKDKVAIENDGSLLPGANVALTGASQLLTALTSGSGKLQSACPCGNH